MFNSEAEREMESVIEIIRSVRNARAEQRIEAAQWIEAHIYAEDTAAIGGHAKAIEILARVRPLVITQRKEREEGAEGALVLVLRDADVVLPLSGMVDSDAEKQRLNKEIDQLRANIARLEQHLQDNTFLSKAPAAVVERERGRLSESQDMLRKLEDRLSELA
jgi:valyl-tRNA synthetase